MRPPLLWCYRRELPGCPGAEGRQEGTATPGAREPSDCLGSPRSCSVVTSQEQVVECSGTSTAGC